MIDYRKEIEELRAARKKVMMEVYERSNEVENLLNILSGVGEDNLVSWDYLNSLKIGDNHVLNQFVSFTKYYGDSEIIRFKCYMQPFGKWGTHYHDCLEIIRVIQGDMIDDYTKKTYKKGDSLILPENTKHTPYSTVESVYDCTLIKFAK